jgi:hypothetical protein
VNACSVEFGWPRELALPGRWIDGGSTYRGLRQAARDWQPRIDIYTARTDHRPADALLIRPDAHIAWAAATGEPAGTAVPALRGALWSWFGLPRPAQNRPGVLERG